MNLRPGIPLKAFNLLVGREYVTALGVLGALILATILLLTRPLARSLNPSIGPLIALGLVLLLPGFLLLRIVRPATDDGGLGLGEWPAALVMSLAFWAVPAAFVRAIHAGWELFEGFFVLGLWILGLAYFRMAWRRIRPSTPRQCSDPWLVTLILVVLGFAAARWVYAGPRDPDDWVYLGVVQQFISHEVFKAANGWEVQFFNLRFTLQVWVFLQAFVARWFQVDPVMLARDLLPALLAPLSLFAYYALAREILGKSGAALLAVLLQVAIYLTYTTTKGWGYGFFARLAQDKFMAGLLVLPLVLLFFWRFMQRGTRSDLIAYALALTAAVFVHPISVAWTVVLLAGFALFNLFSANPFPWQRWLLSTGWVAPLILMALGFRLVTPSYVFDVQAPEVQRYLNPQAHRLVVTGSLYMAHPDLIANALILLGIGLLPITASRLRKDRVAQFLWGGTFFLLAVAFNPMTAWLLGQAIMPWEIWRLTWVLPTSLALAYVFTSFTRVGYFRAKLAYVALVAIAAFTLGNLRLAESLRIIQMSHALDPRVEQALRALPAYLDRSEVVLVPRDLERLTPAFAARAQMIPARNLPQDHSPREINRFYAGEMREASMKEFLTRNQVRYILLPVQSDLDQQLEQNPEWFAEKFRNEEYALYQVIGRDPSHD